jgi:integrase
MPDETRQTQISAASPGPANPARAPRKAQGIRGFGSPYLRGRIWWIRYSHHGRDIRETTQSPRRVDAERLLKARWKQIGRGKFVGPQEEKVRVNALLDALVLDYQNNRRRSLNTLKGRLRPLRGFFGEDRALDLTGKRIEEYKATRLASKTGRETPISVATVNRELAALRRAYRLAIEQGRLSGGPVIKLLAEHNARQGFVEPGTFEAIVKRLPVPLDDLARFAYLTGWRKGEITTLEWADVDRANRLITLRREHSKNEEPRVLKLTGDLWDLIERRWTAREYQTTDGRTALSPYLFHRRGQPIVDFRDAWGEACKKAGVPSLLFHDLRRSAVRNMERAGVSQAVAMKITGHKTPSVYRRYRIVNEDDIERALAQTQEAIRQAPPTNVTDLTQARQAQSQESVSV